jgi:low temperature requirement protein LtrA
MSPVAAPSADGGVTTLELFFDLVFVFTITQLTSVVRDAHDVSGYARALSILWVTWWMYDGFCWLSNNVVPTTLATRLPMLAAMAGFLVMATATPDAYGSGAWAFAVAYLVVVVVHSVQFARSAVGGSGRAILHVAPWNLGIVVGLVLAAALPQRLAGIGWGLAAVPIGIECLRTRGTGFGLRAEHFAERHQLLIIIALGETVVATGVGAQGQLDSVSVVVAALLGIALLAALWWVYFGGDDEETTESFARAQGDELASTAFFAYSAVHLLHIVGLILVAAGLHDALRAPDDALTWKASIELGLGAGLFVLAQCLFRTAVDLPVRRALPVAAVLCLLVTLIGKADSLAVMAVLTGVIIAALILDQRSATEATVS